VTVAEAAIRPEWDSRIPETEWQVYQRVIRGVRQAGIPFAFGGAFATAVYTGELRNTKDFDLYIRPEDRSTMLEVVAQAGLRDHFERLPYDRSWIYRASDGEVIVDTIWAMANQRALVDMAWLTRGPLVELRGEEMRAIPVEELIWCKLYVVQRERCDWGDVLNLIDAQGGRLDWHHLLHRMGEDAPLLSGVLALYGWLSPQRSDVIPESIWDRLGIQRLGGHPADAGLTTTRARLLDARPWFHRSPGSI
jgi:Nucleotidyl transferase of unknown function (DUF2204)